MLHCERCGTSYNGAATGEALACPRCHLKDGIYSPLTYELFDPASPEPRRVAGSRPVRAEDRAGHRG